MNLVRTLLVAIFALCGAATVAAQQPPACPLKLENAPELRGFRLGMPLGQVTARLPGVEVNTGEFGLKWASFSAANLKGSEEAFNGVDLVRLEFVDERLTALDLSYKNSVGWDNNEQFVARVTEALKLPGTWRREDSSATLVCDGFSISVYPNNISMVDQRGRQLVRQRRQAAAEKKRQGFKP